MHRIHLRLVLLLLVLLAAPAFAQDEELAPTGEDDTSSSDMADDDDSAACNTVDCFADVDDDPDGAEDGLEIFPTAAPGDIILTFGTPASSPSTATNAQAFDLKMSRCQNTGVELAGGVDPTFDLELYCNGSQVTVLASGVSQDALGDNSIDQDFFYNWTLTGACAADGSDVEVYFLGSGAGGGSNRRFACLASIEWEVTYASASDEMMVIVAGD